MASNPAAIDADKETRKLQRELRRTRERLRDYELMVDRTQHLLNRRIQELETARASLRERTDELAASERGFRQLAEAAFETLLIHDGRTIVDCNDAATRLYGYARAALVGSALHHLVDPDCAAELDRVLGGSHEESVEMNHRRADGSPVPVEIRSKSIEFHGRPAVVTAVRDITEHKRLQAHLEKLASTDALTGVPNRRSLVENGRREYFRARRYGQVMAAMMIDADHFKRINDVHGHEVGDLALRRLAATCEASLRASDVFARYGGEEFTALLPNTSMEGALELAERVRVRIREESVQAGSKRLALTVSVGVAVLRQDDDALESLLNRADQALYLAKRSGRDRVAYLR